jgi:hypothetical protein
MRLPTLALVVSLALIACDAPDATAPSELEASFDTYSYGTYELVTGSSWNSLRISNTRVIGAAGGRLTLGLHELIVPQGAVGRPTLFRMAKTLGPHVRVELTAHDAATGSEVVSFAEPVELWLSYRFVSIGNADLQRLVVLWLKDDSASGELQPVPTRIERRTRHIVGSLTHFSQYAMGMN